MKIRGGKVFLFLFLFFVALVGLGHFGLDALLVDFVQQLLGVGLVIKEGDGQRMARGVDIDILYTVESQYGVGSLLISLVGGQEIVAILHLGTAIVVAGCIADFVEQGTDIGAAGAVSVVADKEVAFVEMGCEGVDTVEFRQAFSDG